VVPLFDEDPGSDVSGRDPKEFICRLTIDDLLRRAQEGRKFEGRKIIFCRKRNQAIGIAERIVIGKDVDGNR
jgi:hypothetical protein